MNKILNRKRNMARLLCLLIITMFTVSMFTSAFAADGDGGGDKGGGKSFEDALDIIGDDGKINALSTIASSSSDGGLKTFISKYKSLLTGVFGVIALTMLIIFAINIAKLGANGDNEMARKKAQQGILYSVIAFVLFGGASTFVGLFWNVLA